MTPHENLKAAKDQMGTGRPNFEEIQAHALVGILEHLIGTPEPERPVYDEHPKMAPSIGDEIGKAYTENVRMISAAALSAGYGHIPPPGSAKFLICMGCGNAHPLTAVGARGRLAEHWHPKSLGDATINPTVCSQGQLGD